MQHHQNMLNFVLSVYINNFQYSPCFDKYELNGTFWENFIEKVFLRYLLCADRLTGTILLCKIICSII